MKFTQALDDLITKLKEFHQYLGDLLNLTFLSADFIIYREGISLIGFFQYLRCGPLRIINNSIAFTL